MGLERGRCFPGTWVWLCCFLGLWFPLRLDPPRPQNPPSRHSSGEAAPALARARSTPALRGGGGGRGRVQVRRQGVLAGGSLPARSPQDTVELMTTVGTKGPGTGRSGCWGRGWTETRRSCLGEGLGGRGAREGDLKWVGPPVLRARAALAPDPRPDGPTAALHSQCGSPSWGKAPGALLS